MNEKRTSTRSQGFESVSVRVNPWPGFRSQQNKCGSGPANPSRMVCGCPARPLIAQCSEARVSKPHPRRDARLSTRPAKPKSQTGVRNPLTVIAQADGSVLPVGRTVRGGRNAKCPQTRHDAFLEPSTSSPSRTAGNASSPAIQQRSKTSHVCTGDTLLE